MQEQMPRASGENNPQRNLEQRREREEERRKTVRAKYSPEELAIIDDRAEKAFQDQGEGGEKTDRGVLWDLAEIRYRMEKLDRQLSPSGGMRASDSYEKKPQGKESLESQKESDEQAS